MGQTPGEGLLQRRVPTLFAGQLAEQDHAGLCGRRAPQGFSDARAVISAAEVESRLASYKQTAQFDRERVGSA